MARLPAHQAEHNRQKLWEEIRTRKSFVLNDLVKSDGLSRDAIRDYLRGLTKAGYLSAEEQGQAKKMTGTKKLPRLYTLIKDTGIFAPRVRKDGTEVTQGLGREQLWRTMKIMGIFEVRELARLASTDTHTVALEEAKTYVKHLHNAGYLQRTQKPSGRRVGRYRLIPQRNTGPQPPQIQTTKSVYDPNLDKVVWDSFEGRRR